jgi:hypothetical protein
MISLLGDRAIEKSLPRRFGFWGVMVATLKAEGNPRW